MKKGAFRFPMIKVEGSGGESPDPAIYCPANGFIPDPSMYIPPANVTVPGSNPESIIYLVDASYGDFGNGITWSRSGTSYYKIEVFDSTATLIHTDIAINSNYIYKFPTNSGYYSVKVSFVGEGSSFTSQRSTLASTNIDLGIEIIIFNTPNITTLYNSCQYMSGLKSVEFNCTLNYLISFDYAFVGTSIASFTFLNSYPSLTTIRYMFSATSIIVSVVFPWDCHLPLLENMQGAFPSTKLRKMYFPQNLPEVTAMTQIMNKNPELYDLRLWEYAPKLTEIGHFLYDSIVSGELIMPNMPSLVSALYAFINCKYLKKLTFTGPSPNLGGAQSMLERCFMLEEVILPTEWAVTMYGIWGSTHKFMRKLKVPDKLLMSGTSASSPAFFFGPSMEEITGDGDNSALTSYGTFNVSSLSYNTLRIFDVPKFRTQSVSAGTSASSKCVALKTLNWDVENSTYDSTTAPQIKIAAPFDATWLNTLFNRLPFVTDKKLDVQGCDGWNDCDPLIAVAKGWTCYGIARLIGYDVTDITSNTVTSGGNLYFSGQYAISQLGVCYSYLGIPTISNTKKVVIGPTLGEFTCNVTGLIANRTYYLRAYCTTSAGTAYGEVFTFTTLP